MRVSRFIVSFVSLCLVILSSVLLLSCASDTKYENFHGLYEVISQYEEMVSRQESEKAETERQNFVIIIPAKCGADIFNSAAFLSEVMSKFVGYSVEVYYDTDLKPKSTNFEILVGDTQREKSQRYIKELRSFDYGYKYYDGAVTVGAHSDALIVKAVNAFAEMIQTGKIEPVSISAIKPYTERGEYRVSEARLNGFLLSEYVIVYPVKNTDNERSVANYLSDMIEQRFGYTLKVISDSEASESARAVCVGKSSLVSLKLTSSAILSVSDTGNIELLAEDSYGLKLVSDSFLGTMAESTRDGVCDLSLSGTRKYAYQNEDLSFYFVRDDFVAGSIERYKAAISAMRLNSISVFDRLSSSVIMNIRNNTGYLANVADISFYYCDISQYKCIEAKAVEIGDGEIFTLIMERKNGDRFAFIGGFCKKGAKQSSDAAFCKRLAEECEKYSDLPIIVAHEMDSQLDREFADTNPRFVAADGMYGVYFSSDRFELVKSSKSEIEAPLYADVVKLRICFK